VVSGGLDVGMGMDVEMDMDMGEGHWECGKVKGLGRLERNKRTGYAHKILATPPLKWTVP
jgi:hypothetical protein